MYLQVQKYFYLKFNLQRYDTKKDVAKSPVPFLERIALIDFDRIYTRKVRIFCHCFMWVLFTYLTFINLRFIFKFTLTNALIFTFRDLIVNAIFFYLFFYLIIPNTLLRKKIVMAMLSLSLLLALWVLLNHYFIVIMGRYFKIDDPYWENLIIQNSNSNLFHVLSPKHIASVAIEVIYSISPFFFTKIIVDIFRFYSKLFKTERKNNELEIDKQHLERDFLRAQLNPHFLFNTLNNLYGLSLRKDSQTPQTIMQLSNMMRYTLYECNIEMVLLSKEIEFLKNYVLLEKMRYKANKKIVFSISDSQVNNQKIAPLLTFAFIENAFKYGLKSKNEGFLIIDISIFNNIFCFSIVNDKEENMKEKEFGGIGTANISKRLELLYPDKHELKIEDRGKSFYVAMKINLE